LTACPFGLVFRARAGARARARARARECAIEYAKD